MSISLDRAVSVEDLRQLSRKRLPRVLFHFVDDGSEGQVTRARNLAAFDSVSFRPHAATAHAVRDLRASVLGNELSFPVMIAPTGGARMLHPQGEIALAEAANEAGIGYVYPHVGGHGMERVRGAAQNGLMWYQIYPTGGMEVVSNALKRVEKCNFKALVVTVDSPGVPNFEDCRRFGITELCSGGHSFDSSPVRKI